MGFRNGAYATVWDVKKGKGNYYDVQISTSKLNKQTNKYDTDFSNYCRFIGNAAAVAEKLKRNDRIVLEEVDVTSTYDKNANKKYWNTVVFGCKKVDSKQSSTSNEVDSGEVDPEEDDELPF